VFFRAGVLGLMEEIREEKISEILSWLQATARGKMARQTFKKLKAQKVMQSYQKMSNYFSFLGFYLFYKYGIFRPYQFTCIFNNNKCQLALYCVQRTIRNFMIGKTWQWWQLWLAVKPKLRSTKFAEIKASLEAKTAEAEKKKEQEKHARQKAAAVNEQVKLTIAFDLTFNV
jgi:myosin heavy subunit